MEEKKRKIEELEKSLNVLRVKQGFLAGEINRLSREIMRLKASSQLEPGVKPTFPPQHESQFVQPKNEGTASLQDALQTHTKEENKASFDQAQKVKTKAAQKTQDPSVLTKLNRDLEEVIGASLISKIGIGAIVIGVGIGLKYAFDNDLISPLIRILMGYLAGGLLLFFNYRLRKEYPAFSAVLLSGAVAILYFSTYAAYSFYNLLPQALTFAVLVLLTVFIVAEALRANQPVTAHFGLIGAYAVPYLLGDDPDQVVFLFNYVALINLGILFIALWRYWKTLYYTAFAFTWLIYLSWFVFEYREAAHFWTALVYPALFFVIFYLTFLAYKLIRREEYQTSDVLMLLLNSFIFYGLSYGVLQQHETGRDLLGLFTFGNALIHLVASIVVYRYRLASRNLFYLVSGLTLTFATIAIPVQLDGSWVTLLWTGEAALLFWIGRTRATPGYEKIAYVLLPLAFLSLLQDWNVYGDSSGDQIVPIFNVYLITSLWSAACFGLAMLVNNNEKYLNPLKKDGLLRQLLDFGLPLIFLLTLYFAFFLEIVNYFDILQARNPGDENLWRFKNIWLVNYTLFFLTLLSLANILRLKNQALGKLGLLLNGLALGAFLINSFYLFPHLNDDDFGRLFIRYISYLFAGGLLWASYLYARQNFIKLNVSIAYELTLHTVILSVSVLELQSWAMRLGFMDSFQAGMSILFGLYSLFLIGLGIHWSRRHLRIAAIALIGFTLLKVAFVDLAGSDTPTKILVLVTLGALLLGVSFLYNKFRETLFGKEEVKGS